MQSFLLTLSLVLTLTAWPADLKACGEDRLTAAQPHGTAQSATEIIAQFDTAPEYLKSKQWTPDIQRPLIDPIFHQRFNSVASPSFEMVSPYHVLESEWTDSDAIFLKTEQLIGRPVIGWDDSKTTANTDKLPIEFYAGILESFKVTGPEGNQWIKIQIRKTDGSIVKLDKLYSNGMPYMGRFYLIEPKISARQRAQDGFHAAKFQQSVGEIFGTPTVPRDFEVARVAVETFLSLPPSYGATAVIKTLRGQKIDKTKNHQYYGFTRGESRYNDKALRRFLNRVVSYMEESGLLASQNMLGDPDSADNDNGAPDWIRRLKRTPESLQFLEAWKDLAKKFAPHTK